MKLPYRHIIEVSPMSNNDEHVFYQPNELFSPSQVSTFLEPRTILSRPVHQEEINEGLDVNYQGPVNRGNDPLSTQILDAFYLFKNYGQAWKDLTKDKKNLKNPLNKTIAHFTQKFYDAMSGGMPKSEISLIHFLAQSDEANLNLKIYPSYEGDDWYTLKDFLKETSPDPEFISGAGRLLNKIKLIE